MAHCYVRSMPGVHQPLSFAECSRGLVRASPRMQVWFLVTVIAVMLTSELRVILAVWGWLSGRSLVLCCVDGIINLPFISTITTFLPRFCCAHRCCRLNGDALLNHYNVVCQKLLCPILTLH